MLRALARTIVVAVLAGMVAGVLYLGATWRSPASPEEPVARRDSAAFGRHGGDRHDGVQRRATAGRERHGREEASFGRGAAGAGVTALQIGCVGAGVVGLQKHRRRRQHNGGAPSARGGSGRRSRQ